MRLPHQAHILLYALLTSIVSSASAYEQGTKLSVDEGWLVQANRFSLKPAQLDKNSKVLIFFYSASWCAPCKQTGKALAKVYPDILSQAPQLQFATYSVDFTPSARADYLRESRYPWPAIAPSVIDELNWLQAIPGGTPQFQAFAVQGNTLTALTSPGAAATTLDAALHYLKSSEH